MAGRRAWLQIRLRKIHCAPTLLTKVPRQETPLDGHDNASLVHPSSLTTRDQVQTVKHVTSASDEEGDNRRWVGVEIRDLLVDIDDAKDETSKCESKCEA